MDLSSHQSRMPWPFFRRKSASPTPTSQSGPSEDLVFLQLKTEGLPEVWLINRALDGSAEQGAFPWHLSIIIEMEDVYDVGIPTKGEQQLLTKLREELEANLKANDNAHFLASITWNGTRQLLYRVRDPEIANAYLTGVVGNPSVVRPMEYQMEKDAEWVHAATYLDAVRTALESGVPRSRLERSGGEIVVVDA